VSLTAAADGRDLLTSRPNGRSLVDLGDRQARPVVVLLGARRSGMSLAAHILSVLGIDMADATDLESAAPGARWERCALAQLHDRILGLFDRGFGAPFHDLQLPVAWWADPRVRQVQHEITTFLEHRLPARTIFGFKDGRTARLLPIWHQIFRELRLAPKIILCLRNPAAVARALYQKDHIDPEMGEYRWFSCMMDIFRNLRDYETCTIEFENWLPGWTDNLEKLMGFLGVSWDQAQADLDNAVSHLVSQRMGSGNPNAAEARQPLVRSFYTLARRFADEPAAREQIGYIVNQFVAYRQLHRPFEREFERVSRGVSVAEEPRLGQDLAACETALAEATARAEASAERLREVEAERDAALARVESAAAEGEAALAVMRAELISAQAELALRRAAGVRGQPPSDPQDAPPQNPNAEPLPTVQAIRRNAGLPYDPAGDTEGPEVVGFIDGRRG